MMLRFNEMGVLCGSIKVSNQKGVMTSLSVSHHNRIEGDPERAEEEEDPTQGIQKDNTQFKTDHVTTMELQQYHCEHNSGANIDMERFQNFDSAVLQMHQDRKPLKEISLTSGSQLDLESELQDVRKTVAKMQAEVSDIVSRFGIVQPVKATALRYELRQARLVIPSRSCLQQLIKRAASRVKCYLNQNLQVNKLDQVVVDVLKILPEIGATLMVSPLVSQIKETVSQIKQTKVV